MFKPKLVATSNLLNTVSLEVLAELTRITLTVIQPVKPAWVIFKSTSEPAHDEDNGRTRVIPFPGIPKVYAVLDDYGDVETLQKEICDEIIDTQYLVTLMLASDH